MLATCNGKIDNFGRCEKCYEVSQTTSAYCTRLYDAMPEDAFKPPMETINDKINKTMIYEIKAELLDQIIAKQDELILHYGIIITRIIGLYGLDTEQPIAEKMKDELAELKSRLDKEQPITVNKKGVKKIYCSNCGELLGNCDSSCFYKEQPVMDEIIMNTVEDEPYQMDDFNEKWYTREQIYKILKKFHISLKAQPGDEDIEKWAEIHSKQCSSDSYHQKLIKSTSIIALKAMRDGLIPAKDKE